MFNNTVVSCAKTAEMIEMPFWVVDSGGPKKACVTWGARWGNLSNTIELSMFGCAG